MGLKAYMPAFWALPSLILTESAAAGSIGLINSVGNLGGFVGPSSSLATSRPRLTRSGRSALPLLLDDRLSHDYIYPPSRPSVHQTRVPSKSPKQKAYSTKNPTPSSNLCKSIEHWQITPNNGWAGLRLRCSLQYERGVIKAFFTKGNVVGSVDVIDRLSVLCFAGTYGLALLAELARFFVRSALRWYIAAGLMA